MAMLAGMAFVTTILCLYIRDCFRQIETISASNNFSELIIEDGEWQSTKETEPEISGGRQSEGPCVVLDAGHGGNDGGTYYKDVVEKDINLAVVLYLKEILEENEVEVILTRSSDEYMSLEERTTFANQTEADLFVSIHCNYYEGASSIYGVECYYYPGSDSGKQSAEAVLDALEEYDGIRVRESKEEDYYVLKNTGMTAISVEIGYLSNKSERQNLNSADYQQMLAEGLAQGILNNLKETAATND